MLAFYFFTAIFSSLLWLIYSLAYISDNTVGVSFRSLGIVDVSIYTALVVLPIAFLWMIFGYINQYVNMRRLNQNVYQLLKQMKKSQDYTDLIARIMLESEQQIKDGFILNRIDILIADMNELIAEMIFRASLASHEQIESLWGKVKNGGKWALGKVIIEVSQNQPNFQMRIFEKTQRDTVLAGTILEFCARYQNILSLLEKHDKERVFLNVVETGVFGKVYSIMAPIADEVHKHRDFSYSVGKEDNNKFESQEASSTYDLRTKQIFNEDKKNPILSGFSKIGALLKKDKKQVTGIVSAQEKDPFSVALERSFGQSDEPELQIISEPKFEISEPDDTEGHFFNNEEPHFDSTNNINDEENTTQSQIVIGNSEEEKNMPPLIIKDEDKQEITSTQRTLNELKKEWEDMRKASEEDDTENKNEESSENFTYPFGGWTDESNYNK